MGLKESNSIVIPPKIAGIKANIPFYHLAWQINQSFNIKLALNIDWVKTEKDGTIGSHPHYYCYFEDVELHWHLIMNKGINSYFFQSRPMFDFLLICNGNDIYKYFERALDSIQNNESIEHIFQFDFQLLRSKESYFNNILKIKNFTEDLHV